MPRPKHTDIPLFVYDCLRSVAESRVRRALEPETLIGLELPHLSNADIFFHMPDKAELDWREESQPALNETTLQRITVELHSRLEL